MKPLIVNKNKMNIDALTSVKKNLEKRGFKVFIQDNMKKIHHLIDSSIPDESTVGLAGSVTIRELEIDKLIKDKWCIVYDHWQKDLNPEMLKHTLKTQPFAEFFITSVNSITEDGQLVIADLLGNKKVSMLTGPKHVFVIAGMNKIEKNIQEVENKIKNHTVQKLKDSNELLVKYKLDKKVKKSLENQVLGSTTIIDSCPINMEYTIILVPTQLGF